MKVAITGGGIAGLTTAIALEKAGVSYTVYEAAPEIKPVGAGIVLAANAMKALDFLGLKNAVLEKGQLLDAFSILDSSGKVITRTDSRSVPVKYGVDNFSIHRADLHQVLRSFIPGENIKTNKRCDNFESEGASLSLYFKDGSTETADYLLACDGIHSAIRKKLLPESVPRFAGYTCWRGVINLPELQLSAATETWGTSGRFGMVPLPHGNIYFFACIPASQNNSTFKQYTSSDLLKHFQNFHHPIPFILKQAREAPLIWSDICDLKPLRHFAYNSVLLMGDAAHATTPNLGQGACQAIEDAAVLAAEWKNAPRVEEVFLSFEKRRLERTHFITNQSRALGRVAHLQNKYLAAARNTFFKLMPPILKEQGMKKILDVEF